MEKIALLESYVKSIQNDQSNIIHVLNELSELDPTCMSEDDFMTLIKCLPLSPNIYNEEVLAAGCNLIASFCSDDLARHHFGERVTVSTVNLLKSLTKRSVKETSIQKCLLQTCRAVGNLCYYHEENTKHALKEGCLLITMDLFKNNTEEHFQIVLIGLLLNLTHLDDYKYKFPDNMIEELNSFGIQFIKLDSNNHKSYINLVSLMINLIRKSSSCNKIEDYEKCSFIDGLLEKYYSDITIASICVKFIKKVSKTYKNYNWILKGKHKMLIQVLDKHEDNVEEDAKHTVEKICDIITILSNDDGSLNHNTHLEVLSLVEWLLLKVNSNNFYIKLSAVRSLGNFSRFKYESNNLIPIPANSIMKHMPWFINTLEKSTENNQSLIVVSILCLFKNLLYASNFESLDEYTQNKLIKTTIEVLNSNEFNPIVLKTLEIIGCIIKKGGLGQEQLVLYKNLTFVKLVTTHCNSKDEDIRNLAKKLLDTINEDICSPETNSLCIVKET